MSQRHHADQRSEIATTDKPRRMGSSLGRLTAALALSLAMVVSTIAVSAVPAAAATIGFGTTVNASISAPGETDRYYITAKAGDRLSLDRISGSSSLRTRLIAPNGTVIWSANTVYTDRFVNLTQTGTYRLDISYGTYAYTGTYSFKVTRQS